MIILIISILFIFLISIMITGKKEDEFIEKEIEKIKQKIKDNNESEE